MKTPFLIVSILTAFLLGLANARTWTSSEGSEIEADFIRVQGTSVLVNRAGKTIPIPLSRLSEADQKWVAEQLAKPAAPTVPTAKRAAELLEASLEKNLAEAERNEVAAFIASLLPSKGADGEDVEWEVNFPEFSGDFPQESALVSADLFPKGKAESEDRLMWFHIVFFEKKIESFTQEKLGRYPAMRAEGRHLFVDVGRVSVRGVADAESYEADKKIDAVIEAIDLKSIKSL